MVPGGNVSTCNDLGGVRFRREPSRVRAETLSDAGNPAQQHEFVRGLSMGRWRGVPFAAVSVKALRFAPMNAQKTRGLDRRLRCGWFPGMRRMSSSHVPKT